MHNIFKCKLSLSSNIKKEKIYYGRQGFETFCEICVKTLNEYIPRKQKLIRGNHSPFINKEITKAIMKRTKLRCKYLRFRINETRMILTRWINYFFSLIWKQSKQFYWNLEITDVQIINFFGKQSNSNFWMKQNHQKRRYYSEKMKQ